MKTSKKVVLAFLSLFLTSFAFSQQQTLHKVWEVKTTPSKETDTNWRIPEPDEEIVCLHYGDGGSLGIVFKKNDERMFLIHDRSPQWVTIKGTDGFPDMQKAVERKDGLLYLGEENFGKRIPARINSQLFLEFEQLLKEWIENHEGYEADEFRVVLDVAKRMRSNKSVDTTRVSARRNPNTPDTLNLNPTFEL